VLYRLVLFPVTLSDANYPKPPRFRHFVSSFTTKTAKIKKVILLVSTLTMWRCAAK